MRYEEECILVFCEIVYLMLVIRQKSRSCCPNISIVNLEFTFSPTRDQHILYLSGYKTGVLSLWNDFK